MAPPSSLLRDLLSVDGFKKNRKQPDNPTAAPRTTSMPLQHRRPTKPARSQSDVQQARGRLNLDTNGDAGEEQTARRKSSASLRSATSYKIKDGGSGPGAIPALDESALSALISLAAGTVKQFAKDEAFRAFLRSGCTSCVGDSDHRAVLDLRVTVQTVERAAAVGEALLDPRELKRASLRLHSLASLDADEALAVTASGVPHERLAACAHLYMSVVSKLQKKDHSSAVHALEAFCLAPREARTVLLPALWDRLFRPGLSHLKAWRDRESAAARSKPDARLKDVVEKLFVDALDDGTRALACYYRDWLLGRTEAMALPSVPAPPSTAPPATAPSTAPASATRFSTSTTYDIGSDVAYSSGTPSPAMFVIEETPRQPEGLQEEGKAADADSSGSVFHECDGGEVRSCSPTPRGESSEPMPPNMLANEAFEPRVRGDFIWKLEFVLMHTERIHTPQSFRSKMNGAKEQRSQRATCRLATSHSSSGTLNPSHSNFPLLICTNTY